MASAGPVRPGDPASALNAGRRARELEGLTRDSHVDVLVVGGGVTGAGVALDAASRGLTVVLVEKHDLAFGTSRWSSKLVHGGLRYLASGAVGIAYESAVERGVLMTRSAPHLVRALPQLVALLPATSRRDEALVRAGLAAGDALRRAARTPGRVLPRSRRVGSAEVEALAPTVRTDGLRGGLLAHDGQLVDDARLVVVIARTAAAFGARVLTRCEATQLTGSGAVLRDTLTGATLDLHARAVVNAAGVWAGDLAPGITLRPSRGTHLVVSQSSVGGLRAGLTVPVAGAVDRFVFALPADDGLVYVGLTDEDAPGAVPDVPVADEREIDFLLDTVNTALRDPLARADVLSTFSGLRPLLDTGAARTADISRRHAVLTAPDGLVTVVGGKLTTYRRMAEDAVDAVLTASGLPARRCVTADLPLVGAERRSVLDGLPAPRRLVGRYGTEAPVVASAGRADAVADATSVTHAEFAFAVSHEGALDAADLLERRTRLAFSPAVAATARAAAEEAFEAAPDRASPSH